MPRTPRRRSLAVGLTAVLVAAATILTSWTAVQARSSSSSPGVSAAKTASPGSPSAALPGGQTENYTGIAPCRIIDTRKTDVDLTTGNVGFDVSGNLTSQGGSANCGIPSYATSILVNLTGISRSPGGFVRGWAHGSTPPTATLLNYAPAINASNAVTIPLCRGNGCTDAFDLRAFGGKLDLVADVTGYYTAPVFISVRRWSTDPIVKSGVTTVTSVAKGIFELTFDRDVTNCVPSFSKTDGVIGGVTYEQTSPTTAEVMAFDQTLDFDTSFWTVSLTC